MIWRMRSGTGFNPRLPGGRRPNDRFNQRIRPPVSIHAFRGEGDRHTLKHLNHVPAFQSTPSGGKATSACWTPSADGADSFNPRLPGGRRPRIYGVVARNGCGFNPRLPGGRRPPYTHQEHQATGVSIHAFRGEGDPNETENRRRNAKVSIHAFRGEGDRLPF